MSLIVITPPAGLAVSLADAKLHLRVDVIDDDALITAMLQAATEQAESRTGRALLTQTLELVLDAWPAALELPRPPVASITSVKYIDPAGIEQTLAPSAYALDLGPLLPVVRPAYGTEWPTVRGDAGCIRMRYVAGYGALAQVPASIAAWIKLAVGEMYQHRERTAIGAQLVELGFADRLLDPYVIPRI